MGLENSLGVSDVIVRWAVMTAMFLILTYLLRDKVILEGMFGFILPIFVLMPLNVLAKDYLELLELDIPANYIPGAHFAVIFVFNSLLLLVFNKVLPGLTVSSDGILLLFAILVSVVSFLVGSYFPLLEIQLGA